MSDCILEHEKPQHARHGLLCGAHYSRLERTIAETPAVLSWLQANRESGSSHGEHVSGSREPPTPLRIDVHDALVDIPEKLGSWCRLITEEANLAGPANAQPETVCTWLLARLPWVCNQPWVDELCRELDEATRFAHVLAPWRPGRHLLPAPCPSEGCEMLSLVRHDGDDHVTCDRRLGGCGRVWSEDDYKRLTLVLASEKRADVA